MGNLIALFKVKPTLEEEIVKSQSEDPVLQKLVEEVRYEGDQTIHLQVMASY